MKTESIIVLKSESNMIKCICTTCSSYTKCIETGSLGVFCSTGNAKNCLEDLS